MKIGLVFYILIYILQIAVNYHLEFQVDFLLFYCIVFPFISGKKEECSAPSSAN